MVMTTMAMIMAAIMIMMMGARYAGVIKLTPQERHCDLGDITPAAAEDSYPVILQYVQRTVTHISCKHDLNTLLPQYSSYS